MNADWDGDGVPDLIGVCRKGATGKTELHVFSGGSGYRSAILQVPTALHATDENWDFALVDWQRRGQLDLVGICRNGSTGSTEIHVISAESQYQKFLLQLPTGLHPTDRQWKFKILDWNRDGHVDLVAICRRGSSGRTEIHVYSGRTWFRDAIEHITTGLDPGCGEWEYRVVDFDRDGLPDLAAICKCGASGHTEIHMLPGVTKYKDLTYQKATQMHALSSNGTVCLANFNNNKRLDLAVIVRDGQSQTTELHVFSGASDYQAATLRTPTGLHRTDGTWELLIANRTWLDELKCAKSIWDRDLIGVYQNCFEEPANPIGSQPTPNPGGNRTPTPQPKDPPSPPGKKNARPEPPTKDKPAGRKQGKSR